MNTQMQPSGTSHGSVSPAAESLSQLRHPALLGLTAALLTSCGGPSSNEAVHFSYQLSSNAVALPHFEKLPVDARLVSRVFLEREFALYHQNHKGVKLDGQNIGSFADFQQKVWQPFIEEVKKNLRQTSAQHPSDQLAALKLAIDEALRPTLKHYNRAYSSVLDPLLNGRIQCRSGTQLFALAASEVLGSTAARPEEGLGLCFIFLDEHMLPGGVVRDRGDNALHLVGYEMTMRGMARVDFGKVQELDGSLLPMRVSTAIGSQTVSILDLNQAPAGVVLLENKVAQGGSGAARRASTCVEERLGFASGRQKIPDGDLDLGSGDAVPASTYSAPALLFNAESKEQKEQYVQLAKALSPAELAVVKDYLRYNSVFTSWWDQHAEIANNKDMPKAERLQKLDQIIGEMRTFWGQQGLSARFQAAQAIMQARGLQFVVHPAHTHDAIANNRRYIELKE